MGGKGGLRGLGVRAARAIEGRLGQVRRVGQVRVRAAWAENEKAGKAGKSRCLYFGNGSLILRLTFAYRSLFLYRSYIVCIG